MKITTIKKIDIQSRLFHLMAEIDISNLINISITRCNLHFDEVYAQRIFEEILALASFHIQKSFYTYDIIIKKEIEAEELQYYIAGKNYIVLTRSLIHIPSALIDKTENVLIEISRLIENHLDMNLITNDNLTVDQIYRINDSAEYYQYIGCIGEDHVFRLPVSDKCIIHNCLSDIKKF